MADVLTAAWEFWTGHLSAGDPRVFPVARVLVKVRVPVPRGRKEQKPCPHSRRRLSAKVFSVPLTQTEVVGTESFDLFPSCGSCRAGRPPCP